MFHFQKEMPLHAVHVYVNVHLGYVQMLLEGLQHCGYQGDSSVVGRKSGSC